MSRIGHPPPSPNEGGSVADVSESLNYYRSLLVGVMSNRYNNPIQSEVIS